jgi:hypothetical protein
MGLEPAVKGSVTVQITEFLHFAGPAYSIQNGHVLETARIPILQ